MAARRKEVDRVGEKEGGNLRNLISLIICMLRDWTGQISRYGRPGSVSLCLSLAPRLNNKLSLGVVMQLMKRQLLAGPEHCCELSFPSLKSVSKLVC